MDIRPVLFLDSGIGGIPYMRDFLSSNSNESVIYLADRANFPYGPQSKEELILILTELIKTAIEKINPKLTVLACNTATVSAISALRENFPAMPFVGTVPAIKPAAMAGKKIGLLGTARTIEDPYITNLADCEITGIAAPELVEFIELRYDTASENEKEVIAEKYVDMFRSKNIDSLVLGCTHFLYLSREFRRAARDDMQIFDSIDGISRRIEALLDENGSLLRSDGNPFRNIILTGAEKPNSAWQKRAAELNFTVSTLDKFNQTEFSSVNNNDL
jgi:glutamate racemase